MRRVTLLLLSGGGHTGRNVVAALEQRRTGLRLIAISDTPDEPALFNFDAVYLAPTLSRDFAGFERRMLDIFAKEKPDLVVPCRDEDVVWLAGLAERRPDLRGGLLCGTLAIAEMVNDKWKSFEFCRAHGLPFAPSMASGDAAGVDAFIDRHGLPLVAKPRRGVDSKGVFLLSTRAQVTGAMARPDYVVQQYLGEPEAVYAFLERMKREGLPLIHSFQGDKRSLQMLIGPQGTFEHVLCARILATAHNARTITPDPDPEALRIANLCARVFAEAGWRGPLNVQCQPAPGGELMIHEFNARFTGATSSRRLVGLDEVGTAIRVFARHGIAADFPWRECPMVAREHFASRAADSSSVRRLAERGEWMCDQD